MCSVHACDVSVNRGCYGLCDSPCIGIYSVCTDLIQFDVSVILIVYPLQ